MSHILITGGASGLGASITKKLAAELNSEGLAKNRIYFTYCNSKNAARDIEGEFKNCTSIRCNFENASDIQNLIDLIPSFELEVLINNALTGLSQIHFHKMEPQTFLSSFARNVSPTLLITQKSILEFRRRKQGKIITILTSYLIGRPPTGMSEYVANKKYLESMSKSWSSENVAFNISSNCVLPSLMRTELTKNVDDRVIEDLTSKYPNKKLLETTEVAEVVAFLLSTTHVNGTNIVVNGGMDVI